MPKTGERSRINKFLFQNSNTSQTIAKNTFWLSFGEIIGRVLRVIIIFYAARVLGVAGYGTFSYMTSLAAVLTVAADIGLSGVLIREVAKDASKKAAYFSTAFSLKAILVLVSLVFIIFGAKLITGIPLEQTLIYAIGTLFIFDSLRRFGSSLFRAEERMELEGLINIFTQLVIVGAGFVALYLNPTPEALAISYAVGAGVGLLATVYYIKPYVRGIISQFDKSLLKPIITAAWPWTLASIFGVLLVNIDTVMIGWFLDAKEVGLYAAAQKPVAFFYLLPAFIVGGLFPALSRLAADQKDKFREIMERGISMVMLIAYPLVLGILLTADKIVVLFYGAEFISAAFTLQILSLTVLITFPSTIIIHAVFAYNRQKEMVPLWLGGSVANVILNFYLINEIGISGAAWASLITQILIIVPLWIKMRKINRFSATRDIGSVLKATAAMGLFVVGAQAIQLPFSLLLIGAISIYFLSLVLFKDKTLIELKNTMVGKYDS